MDQVLSEDYWEGYYAMRNGDLVKCIDSSNGNVDYCTYNLRKGLPGEAGRFGYTEGTVFGDFNRELAKKTRSEIFLRITDQAENPDRHEQVDSILNGMPDTFSLLQVQNLVRHIKNRGISVFGGPIGGQDLYEGDFEGFYRLEDGNILYCRNLQNWNDDDVDSIVDGVVYYDIIDPVDYRSVIKPKLFGYLDGEKFSELAEHVSPSHGRVISCLGQRGSGFFDLLYKAMNGDMESASVASHRMKNNSA